MAWKRVHANQQMLLPEDIVEVLQCREFDAAAAREIFFAVEDGHDITAIEKNAGQFFLHIGWVYLQRPSGIEMQQNMVGPVRTFRPRATSILGQLDSASGIQVLA